MIRWLSFILLFFLIIPNGNAQDKKAVKLAEKYAKKGEKSIKKNDFETSLEWYTLAINENPNIDAYYMRKGWVNSVLKNDSAAIADFTTGIKRNSTTTQCYLYRGLVYKNIGLYQAAYDDYSNHANIHGETRQTLECKVEALLFLKAYNQVIPYLDQLITKVPKISYKYTQRALCLIETNQLEAAEMDLNMVTNKTNQLFIPYYHVEGLLYLRKKEFKNSIDAFNKLLATTDGRLYGPDSYWYLSNAYHGNGQLDSAIIQINKAISLRENPEYFMDRANYYAEIGELDLAQEDYSKTIALDSTRTGAYNNRTFYVWFPRKEYQKAVEDLSKIIAIDPNNAYAYSNRSYAYLGLKDFEHAFIDAFKSVEMEDRNPYVYKNLALMYYAIGEEEEATNAAKGALNWGYPVDTDPEFQEVLKALGFAQ
jgi:tetratricopeptide (TPR) repeat protein